MELPNTHAHTYGICTHTHTHNFFSKKIVRLEKKETEGKIRKERKKKKRKDQKKRGEKKERNERKEGGEKKGKKRKERGEKVELARTVTGQDIEGIKTGMVTGIGGRLRQAWRRAAMDDVGHTTSMLEGVYGDGHQRTMSTGMDEGVAERRRLREQDTARATGSWDRANYHCHSSGLCPLSPCICASYSASVCFPLPRNARHTCPTQLCPPNHAFTFKWGSTQLPTPRAPNYYTTAG